MKKITWALAGLLALNVGAATAAPLHDLGTNQTVVGVMINDDTFYLEHKLTPKFTIGLQTVDWDRYGDMDDIYGQFHFTDSLRAIVGSRDFGPSSKFFMGLGVSGPLSAQWDGFASLTAGSNHKKFHIGANYKINHNVDLTVSYRALKPDGASSDSGIGVGASYKF